MQTTTYGLAALLRRVKQNSLTVPRFQRRFIWRESQVCSLIDSISRSYPIGSLLLLEKKPDLELASRSIEAEIRDGYPPGDILEGNDDNVGDAEAYILDGQQRTTSIARVFLNSHPTKEFYFNLPTMWELRYEEDTSWIKTRRRGKSTSDRREGNKLIRADVCLDQRKADVYVSEYMEDSYPEFQGDRGAAREASAHIKGIFETIRNYKVPVISIERDSGIESICRVFETINSTGTRLRTFDLAVARYYPNPDLRQLWDDALDEHKILKDFNVDGERALQVLALTATPKGRYPDIARSTLLGLDRSFINDNWRESISALVETYRWARDLGARPETLPNHNVLAAVAAVRSVSRRDESGSGEIWPDFDFVKRWYFSKVLQAGSSQASNYRIGQDFRSLREYVEDDVRPVVSEVALNADMVMKLRPQDVRYKALQCIFSTTIRTDLFSGKTLGGESELHDHHIYPRNAHRRHDLSIKLLDSICNRIYILKESNLAIGEGYPDSYFRNLAKIADQNGTADGFQKRMADCMVPGSPDDPRWTDMFSIENFEVFCRARAQLIVERVREVVGSSLKDPALTEEELVDED